MKKINNVISVVSNIVIVSIICVVSLFCFYNPIIAQNCNTVINGCIYAGDLSSNKVSLMINVYWGTEYIEPILKILDEKQVKCTFFVGGTWVEQEPNLLRQIYDAGHEVASHGYSHKEHEKLTLEQNLAEMQKTHDLVKTTLGTDIKLFAPPGGSYNKYTVEASEAMGYKTIMWTRDTIDWRDQDTNIIYNRAIKNMNGGDLILMHPKEKTVAALPKIIEYAQANNFVITTVSDTIS